MYIPTDDGRWVSEDFERLARVIQDYDHYLRLCWIPPEHRTSEDNKPYMILDTRTNLPVLFAKENEDPSRILGRLFEADNLHGNVLDKLEARNAAAEKLRLRKQLDDMEDARDQAIFMLKSPLNRLRMNGKVFDDQRRVIG